MDEHACDPQPDSPGTVFPPPWRCPQCDTLWVPQDEDDTASTTPPGREVQEFVGWRWRRFDSLTPPDRHSMRNGDA